MEKEIPFIGINRHRLATDGKGVTTLVAFWGCPLRCKHCLNPQSWNPETMVVVYDPKQLFEQVSIDRLYFLATGGGVTFGGGEPLLYISFISKFRKLCGESWNLTVETSLNVPAKAVEKSISVVNNYIVDIKDMNPDIYKRYTGKKNDRVISNLCLLLEYVPADRILIRIPLIPDFNTDEDRQRSKQMLTDMGFTNFDVFEYRRMDKEQEGKLNNK
ncbi:MAG: radical SAM protein [Paludibacteraceae bacterium]|nr:radical SAM protein [Paludibacteraceae bacterium]